MSWNVVKVAPFALAATVGLACSETPGTRGATVTGGAGGSTVGASGTAGSSGGTAASTSTGAGGGSAGSGGAMGGAAGAAAPTGAAGMPVGMAGASMGGMASAGMAGTGGMGAAGASAGGGGMSNAGAGGDTAVGGMGTGGGGGGSGAGDTLDDGTMTFFVTSTGMGDGGNLGGLDGADAFCAQLATAVDPDFARRTWVAYLSTSTVNAIDRIGAGPWRNADGAIIANTVAQLHDAANAQPGGPLDETWPIGDPSVPLDETGAEVPSGGGGGNVHDILTGTLADGTVATDATCEDWTSNADDPNIDAQIGHSNRTGLAGQDQLWNSVHTVGCSEDGANNVTQGGGRGSFYCFAVITGM